MRDDRKKIAPGIYEDAHRRYATIRVRGAGFREKRFALSEPLPKIEQWRQTTRVALLEKAKRGTVAGTFARDAHRYLKDFTQHLASKVQRAVEIHYWVRAFGHKPRGQITTADVARVRAEWLLRGASRKTKGGNLRYAPASPKTINNRVQSLRHLYHCLDGKAAWTPCDDLDPLDVHKTPMQFVPDALILQVDQQLQQLEQQRAIRSPKTRARFRVLVATGRRPSEVMRTQPHDLDLQRRIWIPRDGKGGFSPGLYLNDDMLAAWQFFIEVDAWGPYDTDEHARRLYRAGWPKGIKPYQARHTVGITLAERGIDLDDISPHMGHRRRETTRKHYVPVLNSRMQKVSETLNGRFQRWPTLQTSLQTTQIEIDKNGPESTDQQTERPTGKQAGSARISSMKTR